MSIGTFAALKNEIAWIENHLQSFLPHVDEMVFFDGNSTDGTLEVLRKYARLSSKITLKENKDCNVLEGDYVVLFNEALRCLSTDLAWFVHPDMELVNPEALRGLPKDLIAATTQMETYAGEPGGQLYKINGRAEFWKNIYRLRNPDLGAHYFGYYGAWNEDVYFSELTGSEHEYYGQDIARYPYPVFQSNIKVKHYSDVRPHARRLSRMITCLKNQGYSQEWAEKIAATHPRVTLKDGQGLTFEPVLTMYSQGRAI